LKAVLNWLGYTRRERRGSAILLALIFLIFTLRYMVPQSKVIPEDISAMIIPYNDVPEVHGQKSYHASLSAPRSTQPQQERRSSAGTYRQAKIDLNRCDSADLDKLPGIGPVLSARIIKYRNLLGGYSTVEQLREVYGLRDSTFMLISGRVSADSALLRKININTAVFSELLRHPYLDKHDVQAIMKYRELKGRAEGISELIVNGILPGDKASRVSPYLDFD